MRLTGSRAYARAPAVPKMPPGLVEIMEGLTKDVLKNNPTNIYQFCANHFEKLLEVRDGPSSQKSLTLEEKIFEAQEKVRQRAKERQKRYDNQVQSHVKHENDEYNDSGKEVQEQDSTEQEVIPSLRAPVHHDQDLSLASEMEISHELFTDNSLTSKESINESDEIPISKSSTLSSVSKTTVIDLLGNDQDNSNGIEDLTIQINNADEPNNGSENVDFQKDNISTEKLDTFSDNDGKQENIQSSFTNSRNQSVIEEESAPTVLGENNTEKEFCNTIENNKQNENFEELSIPVDIESEHKVDSKSIGEDVNKERDNITDQIEIDQADNSECEREVTKINTEDPNQHLKELNTSDDKSLELLSRYDVDSEKSDNIQVDDNSATFNENPVESLVDTAQPMLVTDQKHITIETSLETTNESLVQVTNDENPQMGVKQFQVTDMKTNDSELSNCMDNINTEKETTVLSAHSAVEVSDVSITNLNDNQYDDHGLEEINEFPGGEEKVNDNENSNTSIPGSGSIDNNYDSSVIESDISKAEDDIPRSDNDDNEQNNMDLETAAVTIQKVFRSFLFKSRNSTFEDITNDEATSLEEDNDKKEEYFAAANLSQERRPLGITRMDTVLQTVNEEKSLSLSTDDSSTLSSAATTIQAHVRGFLVRNKLNSYKTVSTNSLVNSNELLDTDTDQQKNKTVLNIHIVPEEGNYLSRDESLITSMDLSLDGSPPSSINLHPLSYDLVSERRKLLKREDAIQSVSPPSNNSGKLSEESLKEVLINENEVPKTESYINEKEDQHNPEENLSGSLTTAVTTVSVYGTSNEQDDTVIAAENQKRSMSLDESDVITPFTASPRSLIGDMENSSKLLHSGEFHDVVLPTKVSRSDTTVVREFKNVLAYILLWNSS